MTLPSQLSIALLESLPPVLAQLRTRRPPLADQLERAATSVTLNLAEAFSRTGRDRLRVMRIAAAEAREVNAALTVARCLHHCSPSTLAPSLAISDRLCAVLFGLLRKLG